MATLRSRPVFAPAIFAGLLFLTVAAYAPVFRAGYVWDDDSWLTGNPAVQDPRGLHAIWTSVPRMQYYPLLFTSYWVEDRLYGDNPLGYHLVNVLLHAGNAFLVGMILRTLRVPGAFWVAAIFAVHPVHVESVAWVTERKNVLSGLFCLGATLAFLKFEGERRQATYAAALGLFLCALLSKTATAPLPVALAALSLWRYGPARLRDFVPLVPFVLVAAALAFFTVSLEKDMVAVVSPDFGFTPWQRALIAARAFSFYPFKLLVPYPLIFNYPRFDVAGVSLQSLWPPALLTLLCVVLALLWRSGRRGLACAVLVYAAMIFPALGFFDVYAFRFSFVADHFQYLASIGILALLPQAGSWLMARIGGATPSAGVLRSARAAAVGLVLVLAVLTWRQAHAYRDEATLWRDTIAKNADSWIAHHNLATILSKSGQVDEAIAEFTEAIRCKPNAVESYSGRGLAYKVKGRADLALVDLDRAMELDSTYPQAYLNRGEAFAAANRFQEAIGDLDQFLTDNPEYGPAYQSRADAYFALNQYEAAIADYDEAIKYGAGATAYRDRATAQLQLGHDEPALADLARALQLDPDSAELHVARGFALVRIKRHVEALADFDAAERLDPNLAPTFVLRGGLYQRIDGSKTRACEDWRRACRLGDCKLFQAECAPRAGEP